MVTVNIVGKGAVGEELMDLMKLRQFPLDKLRIFASPASCGKILETPFGQKTIESLANIYLDDEGDTLQNPLGALEGYTFFCAGGETSKQYAQRAAKTSVVIDNSSAFRYDAQIPLIIPEINASFIQHNTLIANPNCTTAIAAIPLHILHQLYGIKRISISTYQSASGAGGKGMDELLLQQDRVSQNLASGQERYARIVPSVFPHQLVDNVIPRIDVISIDDYTKEEMKVDWELHKILGLSDSIKIGCTAVRIPVLRAHSEVIDVETERSVDLTAYKSALQNTKGLKLVDNVADNIYPTPLQASKDFDVLIGRIRPSHVYDTGVTFFVSGDQLWRGAALNALLIAEYHLSRN
jgi:aspartate-semialdehyde dehydrogenase